MYICWEVFGYTVFKAMRSPQYLLSLKLNNSDILDIFQGLQFFTSRQNNVPAGSVLHEPRGGYVLSSEVHGVSSITIKSYG